MAKTKAQKVEIGLAIGEKLRKTNAMILAEYRGITAEELRDLRLKLKQVGSEFTVVKNRLLRKAIDEGGLESAQPVLNELQGPLGIVNIYGDVAKGSKVLLDFQKDVEQLKVTVGVMDGALLSKADIKALSELPSKEVLLAKIAGALVAPHRGLLSVINGLPTKLVRTLAAVRDQKAS